MVVSIQVKSIEVKISFKRRDKSSRVDYPLIQIIYRYADYTGRVALIVLSSDQGFAPDNIDRSTEPTLPSPAAATLCA